MCFALSCNGQLNGFRLYRQLCNPSVTQGTFLRAGSNLGAHTHFLNNLSHIKHKKTLSQSEKKPEIKNHTECSDVYFIFFFAHQSVYEFHSSLFGAHTNFRSSADYHNQSNSRVDKCKVRKQFLML